MERESESGGKIGDLDAYQIEGWETRGEVIQNLAEFQFSCVSNAGSIKNFAAPASIQRIMCEQYWDCSFGIIAAVIFYFKLYCCENCDITNCFHQIILQNEETITIVFNILGFLGIV